MEKAKAWHLKKGKRKKIKCDETINRLKRMSGVKSFHQLELRMHQSHEGDDTNEPEKQWTENFHELNYRVN